VATDIEERLDELRARGLYRSMRLVSGPQGPHVLLDGRPVLLLCSSNYLGLADHPRVREAAAEGAMRWGAGAGGPRLGSGTMTVHRRLEERLADFHGTERCLLFGSGYLAGLGLVPALAREGEVVFHDGLCHASILDGCRLAEADSFAYRHGDLDHLEWGLRQAGRRGSLIVTEGVFATDGALAPLPGLVDLARGHDARLMVDESHAVGALGPGGRGAAALAGLEDEVDVMVGALGKSLGSYGAYACCDAQSARLLANTARTLTRSTALPPPAVAAALAALEIVEAEPSRVERLARNARVLREALVMEGEVGPVSETHIQPVWLDSAQSALAASDLALRDGLLVPAPAPSEAASALRLTVMASHTKGELRSAAGALSEIVRRQRYLQGAPRVTSVESAPALFDGLREAA
jgi:8-amino-7-oxononanoate synthase